jgi:hypothetical protein
MPDRTGPGKIVRLIGRLRQGRVAGLTRGSSPPGPLPIPMGLGYFHPASPRIISNWGTDGGQNDGTKEKRASLFS